MRLRTVAKDGALAALSESKPGVQAARRDVELEAARAEAARLGEAVKELAVKLVLVEGKGVGAEWPGPAQGGSGHQGRAAGPAGAGLEAGLDGAGGLPGVGAGRAAHLPVAGPPGRRRTGRSCAWWPPDARPAGLGGCRDRGVVSPVGRGRPLPPQARPPRLVSGASLG